MARFRAYASDSSDDESAPEPEKHVHPEDDAGESESDQESSSSSSSSDMHEDELVASMARRQKKPSRTALVEDEDGEIRYAHEVGDSQAPNIRVSSASSSSSPPPQRARGDPTIIPWAQQIGVDAQKMHVMQTSLFRVPEEAAALKNLNQPTRQNLRVPLQQLNRKHSRDSDGDGLRMDSRERASFAHDVEPPLYRPSRKYSRVDSSESAVSGNEDAVLDAGLAFGRSFRVGWGPGGTLVHLGTLCGPCSTSKIPANSSTITKTIIPIFASASQGTSLSSKLLQHHLSNSPITPDDDGIPFATPSPTTLHFSSFASLFPPADRSYEASLFRLGQALFDKIDLRLGDSITVDISNRITSIRRKAALAAWLEDAVIPAVEADLRSSASADGAAIAFTLLTGNQTEKALSVAMDGGYLKLATLISQAGGDWEFREDLKVQLQLWKEQRIDTHIDESVRKVYALLAGVVDGVIEGSKGGGLEKCSDIDVVKDLDWKRVFGLHLWFSEPIDASIAQVFQAYDQLIKNASQRQIARPLPWYTEKQSMQPSPWNLPSPPTSSDGLFSLIRLHAEPACSLSQILTPLSFSASPADYSLAWHLYIILSRCMGVRDFADRGEPSGRGRSLRLDDSDEDEGDGMEGHSPSADLLASCYALQLESQGMIQEALFVLLHIEGSAGREKAIKDLLARSAGKLDEWMTRGIVGSLKIPMAWVNEAKALYALDGGDVYEAYELFISASLYNQAHDLAVLELAPDAVLCRDFELLKSIFTKFVGRSVDGWHVRGKIFLDYVHIMTRMPELQESLTDDAVPDAHQSSEIDDLAKSVPKIIAILPDVLRDSADLRHAAALAEMVSNLVGLVDKVRPLVLAHAQPLMANESTKLSHIHSMAYARQKLACVAQVVLGISLEWESVESSQLEEGKIQNKQTTA
ncbi:Nuclear pore complex protein Nup98-Nup96 [Hypsizygus marmoreus]|uniref:Nuclear pore complex protein Nup98-Nup96 n=1 Tax=Hypsizygus marmoreus TaxID=39966 RepID=A0A369JZX9_HYPMA|nr:Nuclear pore complex protein Nup98-Nup96 [Hypsizygus marmoreus]